MPHHATQPQKITWSILGGVAFYFTPFSAHAVMAYLLGSGSGDGSVWGACVGLTTLLFTFLMLSHFRPTRRHLIVFLISLLVALLPLLIFTAAEKMLYPLLSNMMWFGLRWHELYAVSYLVLASLLASSMMFYVAPAQVPTLNPSPTGVPSEPSSN